jgi:hypothetical protein
MGAATPTSAIACGDSEADPGLVAYAARELRDEITLQLTLAEVALADPYAGTVTLRDMGEQVVAACERQGRLLDALLALVRSQYGHLRHESVDLAATAAQVLRAHDALVTAQALPGGGLRIHIDFPATSAISPRFSASSM